jgi:hypothetical protein
MRKFMVQQNFGYGWDDAGWTCDDTPMRFDSVEEAQAEIDEFIADCAAAGMDYGQKDYRIVEVRK